MMRRVSWLILLTLAIIGRCPVGAADGDGGYAGAFLQVPIGARPAAMGGAFRAISDDGAAPLYNPAGIANLKKPLFATSYRLMKLDRRLGYVSLLFPTSGRSALGVNWLYAGSGPVMKRNYDGDPLGEEISSNNHDFSIVFAKRFEAFFSAGIKMNYLHSTLAGLSAYSVGIDLGVMFYVDHFFGRERTHVLPVKNLQIGLTLKYLDASYLWNNESYVLRYIDGESGIGTEQDDQVPTEFGMGVSGRFLERKLVLAADLLKNLEQGASFHAGSEYFVSPEFALRAGFSDGRLTAGSGYVFKLADRVLAIDYAFSTDKADEGSEHIFSFDLLF